MKLITDLSDSNLPEDIIRTNAELRGNRKITVNTGSLPYAAIGPHSTIISPYSTMPSDDNSTDAVNIIKSVLEKKEKEKVIEYPLERWDIQIHTYRDERAIEVGLLSRLFSGNTKQVTAGVIHDAKRFSLTTTEEGRKVEVGVAVRLSVATERLDGAIDLTLPNLAASAQLNKTDTRVGLSVIGYAGPLGKYLPAPSKFDVETCVEYLNAFKALQELVFGANGLTNVIPTVLNYEEDQSR